jgi:hypothetical protein
VRAAWMQVGPFRVSAEYILQNGPVEREAHGERVCSCVGDCGIVTLSLSWPNRPAPEGSLDRSYHAITGRSVT